MKLSNQSHQPLAEIVQGTIKKTGSGAGFLIPHAELGTPRGPEIALNRYDLGDAQTGDEVLVRVAKGQLGSDGKRRGRVVEILQRATRTFVGSYFESGGQGWVQIVGTAFNTPISVGDPGAKGAQPNDSVVLEMLRFPSHADSGEAVVTHVLGPRGAVGVDALAIIHEFGLPDEFPPEVLEESRQQAVAFDEHHLADRLDLTDATIVTIDPVDARDFDDAISLSRSDDGHWHLGVHIADVAHFVPLGSALDKEARRRGTSVYLPDRVLPMLPEVLSNGLASLQQGRIRFTRSALMEFTADGVFVHAEFARSAIKVTRRFAYEQVMPLVQDHGRPHKTVSREVRELLGRMYELAMILRARRFAAGSLELNLPEVKIDFDAHGKVCGAHVAPHDASHEIIEEFMLAANQAVAGALADCGIPFLRRVHANPDRTKLEAFAEFVKSLGYPLYRFQSRHELQELLNRVTDTPHHRAVNYALLRSLKQAEYSPERLGHYALAIENYCHFTSPIRRYPDLTIHRLLDAVAARRSARPATIAVPGEVELIVLGRHCSQTERRAEQAERELAKVKLLTFMAGHVGEEFEALITGVQEFGFFCQVVDIPAEGLVHVSSLANDYYYLDSAIHALIGRRSGREFRLGAPVRVIVARVDVDRRQLDFRLANVKSPTRSKPTKPTVASGKARKASSAVPPPGSPKPAKKRGKPKKRNRGEKKN